MELTLGDVARIVQGRLVGDPQESVSRIASIRMASKGDLAFVSHPKYIALVQETKATAVLLAQDMHIGEGKTVIYCENPSFAFTKIAQILYPARRHFKDEIHRSAVIAKGSHLDKGICVGPSAVIEEDVRIGEGSCIGAGVFIGKGTCIGSDTLIYPNVSIMSQCSIGNRVIIHSGTVIGSDGYGFVTVDGVHHKIPQIGIVV
ncbi:MAG: LpxD N-terminal domain-containing protein, partial [Chlamydiota bacterium]|nr:LpxD N-terminal domain-containing protein [Chlamydiota bacterium]